MSAVHQAGLDLGGRYLWLSVWERNPRAIAFYSKEGFIDVGSHDFHVGSDRRTDRLLVAAVRLTTMLFIPPGEGTENKAI
jgi:ribosomal protein S18 acetylase RimI-like enzyme